MKNIGRNDPCPCGSGKKYKHCCLPREEAQPASMPPIAPPIDYLIQTALEHHNSGHLPMAEAVYLEILQAAPYHPDALHFSGVLALQMGKLDIAVERISKAIQLNPSNPMYYNNLGNALKDQGKLDAAVEVYRRALSLKPDYADALYNLGHALQGQGKLDAAVAFYRQALSLKPDLTEAHNSLGTALQDQGQLNTAISCFQRALSLRPNYAKAHNNLGNALRIQGKLDAAVESYRRALALKQDYAEAYSNLLFLHGYHASLNPGAYLSLARSWERACVPEQDRQAARGRTFKRSPLSGRRLRVGYVSGDFRQHAVSYFIEQLFAAHDKARIELFAYTTNAMRDAVTARLQGLTEHWLPVAGLSDAAIRDRIEADGIDVLVDLSGHTAHNRMGVFARRAAPVQAHYLGYFASMGLSEMDYWIGDEILTPPAMDLHFSEQVWRLPRVWVSYKTVTAAPAPVWRPAGDGSVWVGSFNNLGKLTAQTLALWARVLHALPEGRLLLKTKALADAGNRRRILETMAGHGIAPDRIELQRDTDWMDYMDQYNRLDLALDPVGGHGGGTTTCDALWMGIPVITLEGDRATSRFTASMLCAIGHPEWIARSESEYVDKVVALARDRNPDKTLRSVRRESMADSPLCDAKDLASKLEDAYLKMNER